MSFRAVFIALVLAFALVIGAFLINRHRPAGDTNRENADFVRATGSRRMPRQTTGLGGSRV